RDAVSSGVSTRQHSAVKRRRRDRDGRPYRATAAPSRFGALRNLQLCAPWFSLTPQRQLLDRWRLPGHRRRRAQLPKKQNGWILRAAGGEREGGNGRGKGRTSVKVPTSKP